MTNIKTKKSLSRRDALKVLGAAGAGAASAFLLPGKWDKPAMQMGVLPAHAQSSQITYYSLVDSGERFYFAPNEDYFVDLIAYIDPADTGVAIKATYWIDAPAGALSTNVYSSPVSVTPVNTVGGKATFAPIQIVFYWVKFKVTYEFVNPAQCKTGCSWTVEHTNQTDR